MQELCLGKATNGIPCDRANGHSGRCSNKYCSCGFNLREKESRLCKECSNRIQRANRRKKRFRLTAAELQKAKEAAGRTAGGNAVKNEKGIFAPGYDTGLGGRISCHLRWHVARNVYSDKCDLCMADILGEDDAETEKQKD